MAKILYKPVGILAGVIAGLIAGQIFQRIWALLGSGAEPPDPDDVDAGWTEIIVSSVLMGAVFGGVRAAVQRGGAKGFQRATGIWPGGTKDKG